MVQQGSQSVQELLFVVQMLILQVIVLCGKVWSGSARLASGTQLAALVDKWKQTVSKFCTC